MTTKENIEFVAVENQAKDEVIKTFGSGDNDTGSASVQVALLTRRINQLNEHFNKHKKDFHSRRGLLKMVSQRRKQLDYLKTKDIEGYRTLLKRLGLRR